MGYEVRRMVTEENAVGQADVGIGGPEIALPC
jgi:hypothetical protein